MNNYIISDYVESSDTDISLQSKPKPKPNPNPNVVALLEKPIDDNSLKSYGLSKPRRITVKARVIHDQN